MRLLSEHFPDIACDLSVSGKAFYQQFVTVTAERSNSGNVGLHLRVSSELAGSHCFTRDGKMSLSGLQNAEPRVPRCALSGNDPLASLQRGWLCSVVTVFSKIGECSSSSRLVTDFLQNAG